jgi:hypothetical protein
MKQRATALLVIVRVAALRVALLTAALACATFANAQSFDLAVSGVEWENCCGTPPVFFSGRFRRLSRLVGDRSPNDCAWREGSCLRR